MNADLIHAFNCSDIQPADVEVIAEHYDSVLEQVLNKHAPEKKTMLTIKPRAPWYNQDIAEAKKLRRKLERKWRRTKLTVDREIFKEQKNQVNMLIRRACTQYFKEKVDDCGGDQRSLFKIVDQVLRKNPPSPSTDNITAESMSRFFTEKIKCIWEGLIADVPVDAPSSPTHASPPAFPVFQAATNEEVFAIIKTMSNASCDLDPMPTTLVKQHLITLVPVITQFINASIQSGTVPGRMKTAVIAPRLKKSSLDDDDLKSYRPISNLPFLSKVLERVIASRLTSHMRYHQLHEPLQSAYKASHSTETALLKVKNDIITALDGNQGVLMVLLDLSAAFDTVSHHKLLEVLEKRIGLCSTALDWFKSYLSGRTQSVRVADTTSSPTALSQVFRVSVEILLIISDIVWIFRFVMSHPLIFVKIVF